MLHLAVCAGLRVSELTGLCIDDVALPSMNIRVHGKGRRERALPLWKTTATALRAWMATRGVVAVPEVFVSARGKPLSRWGFAYLLKRHAEAAGQRCPQLLKKQVSPHVLRHTSAMIVLQATQDIGKVSLWLGHSNLKAGRTLEGLKPSPSSRQPTAECAPARTPPRAPTRLPEVALVTLRKRRIRLEIGARQIVSRTSYVVLDGAQALE
jgi:integrase